MNQKAPLVSVLMPVYNCQDYVKESVESILSQSFIDYEFIIINDGSTDRTGEILQEYSKEDKRIRLFHQENKGIVKSRNKLCMLASGKYIAWQDGDDISYKDRLKIQIRYLETHQDIGILGTWINSVDKEGMIMKEYHFPVSHYHICWRLFFRNPIAQPSVVMKNDLIREIGHYREGFAPSEDYDLWTRACLKVKLGNIHEILVNHRVWGDSSWEKNRDISDMVVPQSIKLLIKYLLGKKTSLEEAKCMRNIGHGSIPSDINVIKHIMKMICEMLRMYVNKYSITKKERKDIYKDTAKMLYALASNARRSSLLKSLPIYFKALSLNPRLYVSKSPD